MWIPIPPIFVSENLNWKFEVIDWLQRISTILEFLWNLKNNKIRKENLIKNWLLEPSYLKSLEWMKFDNLPDNLQSRFLNSYRIDLNILTSESDTSAKYELFNRLNSWWDPLTAQEIRNTLILQFNKEVYDSLKELSKNDNFINILNITEKKKEKEKDTEFVLRFQALLDYSNDSKIKSVSKFLDNEMKKLLKDNSINKWIFDNVFNILSNIDEWNCLKRTFQVNIPWFDSIAWWIWFNLLNKNIDEPFNIDEIDKRIKGLWISSIFEQHTWSKTWKFVEHKLIVSLFIGRKLFNLKENFWTTEEEISENINDLIKDKFNSSNN
jgi:hypothetical protein